MKSKGNRTQFELAGSSSYRGSTVHVYCICALPAVVSPGRMLCYEGREATASNLSIEHARPRDTFVKMSNSITSSCFAGNIRDLNIQQQDGNENINEMFNRFDKQNNNFALASRFFGHFFAVFVWNCLISHFMDNINKQGRNFISLRTWTWIWSLGIQIKYSVK